MAKKWILVLDSGLGGKHTMQQIKEYLPHENYLLFMDKLNCPYGNKSRHKLKKIVTKNIKKLLRLYNIKLVVIACNTLSSMFSKYLQKTFYNIPFVFVLPKIQNSLLQHPTLILSTKNTAKYNASLKKLKNTKNAYVLGFTNLAKQIDNCGQNYNLLQPYLNKKLKPFANKNIKNVVLGCTHFNYIKPQLQIALNSQLQFYENSVSVAKKVKTTLLAAGCLNKLKTSGDVLQIYHI